MRRKFYPTLIVFLFIFSNCTSSGSSKVDYKSLANDYCKCVQPSIELSEEMERLQKENRKDEMIAKLKDAQKIADEALGCCQTKTDATTGEVNKEKIKEALLKHCKNIPDRLASDLMVKLK